jgi:hypothetical protein
MDRYSRKTRTASATGTCRFGLGLAAFQILKTKLILEDCQRAKAAVEIGFRKKQQDRQLSFGGLLLRHTIDAGHEILDRIAWLDKGRIPASFLRKD